MRYLFGKFVGVGTEIKGMLIPEFCFRNLLKWVLSYHKLIDEGRGYYICLFREVLYRFRQTVSFADNNFNSGVVKDFIKELSLISLDIKSMSDGEITGLSIVIDSFACYCSKEIMKSVNERYKKYGFYYAYRDWKTLYENILSAYKYISTEFARKSREGSQG